MHVVIMGAGAVGGYFGGKLALASVPVTFLVRENRARQLQQTGLRVKSLHGDFEIQPNLATTPHDIEHPDVVILAMKNYHLDNALPDIRALAQRGAKILPLLNGVRHLDTLAQQCGPENVLGGLCYIESTLDSEGAVLQTSPMQDIVFGSLGSGVTQAWLKELEQHFVDAKVNVRVSDAILPDMWRKYIFLVSLSGITSTLRSPIGVAREDEVTMEFLKDMIAEPAAVARARGVQLPSDLVEQIAAQAMAISPAMTSSMHRDLEKGLPLELDSLQGAVLEMAAEHNLPVPCMRAVYALLHPFKEGKKA
ncbi:ketopantoate reductase family protein [Alicyclobacillus tolerans]|uniref:ketopantoate reductase family protein n=1 Tax=Alicyclobacillus tolerans TaxID=90970 RepID=UPI001F20208C|nr:ketopantoate reductase family protein [Alicyclobacillus tolerans]MCF8566462.1 ketopantoate reductase family protein [Alicyclobacillus tolerans]